MESIKDTTGSAFSDDEMMPGPGAEPVPRRRWPWVVAIAAIAAAGVAAGLVIAGNLVPAPPAVTAGSVAAPTASAPLTTEPGPGPSASSASPSSAQSTAPATGGPVAGPADRRYVSAAAGASFELPDGWTAEESTVGSADYPGTRIIVFNEDRMQVAALYHGAGSGVGGACGPGPYPITELDTAPALDNKWATAAGVRFSYRVLDMRADGGAFDYQIGLVDRASGELTDGCLMYSFVNGAPRGTLSFANRAAQSPRHDDPIFNSMAEARDYLATPEYRKLKAMILSLEMQD